MGALSIQAAAECDAAAEPNWPRVAGGFTSRATWTRDFLVSGVLSIDLDGAEPERVMDQLRDFARGSVDVVSRLRDPVEILGELFNADLSDMSLGQLRVLCRAIARLGKASAPNPCWARPSEAYATRILLLALGDDLRELSGLHRQLYEEFSEDVWLLRCARRTPTVDRWWQAARRRRVRRQLATATRTGGRPSDVRRSVATLRRANELQADIDEMSATINVRLGSFAEAGIPDVDAATEALTAIEGVATALAHRLDPAVLHDLAAADAFICKEVTLPATRVVLIISAWAAKAMQAGAEAPLTYTPRQLEQWVAGVAEALDVLSGLRDVTAWFRGRDETIADLFEHAIVCERLQDLCGSVE